MIASRLSIIGICALLLSAAAGHLSAQGKKKFTVKDLPKAVSAAFHKAYPKAEIRGAGVEKEKGVLLYEVESRDGATQRDLLYRKDGTVVEIEETIPLSDVPDLVTKSLARELPGAKILKAEKTTRGAATGYEMSVESKGKKYSVAFDGNGKLLEKEAQKAGKGKGENEKEENEKED